MHPVNLSSANIAGLFEGKIQDPEATEGRGGPVLGWLVGMGPSGVLQDSFLFPFNFLLG